MRPKVLDTLRDPGSETQDPKPYIIFPAQKRGFCCHLISLKTVYTAGSIANGTVFSLSARVRFISNETKRKPEQNFRFLVFFTGKTNKSRFGKKAASTVREETQLSLFPAVFPSNFLNFRFDRHSRQKRVRSL